VDPIVGAGLAVLNGLVLLGLLAVEAHLTASGEHKLAAGTSGLSVLAAITLLLLATVLTGHLLRRLRRETPKRPPAVGDGGALPREEAPLGPKETGRRP
jgi:hypothetical protein